MSTLSGFPSKLETDTLNVEVGAIMMLWEGGTGSRGRVGLCDGGGVWIWIGGNSSSGIRPLLGSLCSHSPVRGSCWIRFRCRLYSPGFAALSQAAIGSCVRSATMRSWW